MADENTIQKLPKGIHERIQKNGIIVYDCIVSYRDSLNGKWKLRTKTAPSIGKAKKLRAEMLHEVKDGFTLPTKITVKAHLEQWLEHIVRSTLSINTYELYKILCTKHLIPTLGSLQLSQLRPQQIQSLYAEKLKKGLSPRTVQLIHVCLHKALKNAVKTGLILINPIDAVSAPRDIHREMKTMDKEGIVRFLGEARKKCEYYALFYLYLFTGPRRNEALALRWKDIDLLGAQLSVNKTMQFVNNEVTYKQPKTKSSRRQIALSPSTCVTLRLHRESQDKARSYIGLPSASDNDLVFCHPNGNPYLPNTITHAWIKLVRRCNLYGVRLHDARHTHAKELLRNGTSPKVIQERLGHASFNTTMNLYAHVSPGMQKEAANRFDDAIIGNGEETISV